jgi:hypothetical protein
VPGFQELFGNGKPGFVSPDVVIIRRFPGGAAPKRAEETVTWVVDIHFFGINRKYLKCIWIIRASFSRRNQRFHKKENHWKSISLEIFGELGWFYPPSLLKKNIVLFSGKDYSPGCEEWAFHS